MTNFEPYLRTSLSKYKNAEATKREVINIFAQYRDLRPNLEPFVFNDGTQKELLKLEGTIPVCYKGNTYNIPVCIWILDTHPQNPPMVYIRPTSTMQIKPSRYVDANGKVDLPFLRDWKPPQSDLLSLIQILIMTFGEECPVFSKVPPRPPPPFAPGSGGGGGGGGVPPYPPYPPAGGPQPGSMPMPSLGGGGSANPPYPSYTGSTGYPGGNFPPYPTPGYPSQTAGFQGYPPQASSFTGSGQYPPAAYPYGSNPTYPASSNSYQATSTATTASTNPMDRPGTGTITEDHIRASLLSAVEDKMKWRLRETFAQAQAEMDVLKKTQGDLNKGKEKLEQMIQDLKREKEEVDRNVQLLQDKDNELKDALQKLEGSNTLDIDEAVVTTTPLYRQLLNSFAEEQAIEDAIYYLGEALRKNVIDLEVFLKQVRELSRKQFMLRALIQKCREKAGLPPLA